MYCVAVALVGKHTCSGFGEYDRRGFFVVCAENIIEVAEMAYEKILSLPDNRR